MALVMVEAEDPDIAFEEVAISISNYTRRKYARNKSNFTKIKTKMNKFIDKTLWKSKKR